MIKGMHAEPGAPASARTARVLARSVEDLARFLGATAVELTGPAPERWRRALG